MFVLQRIVPHIIRSKYIRASTQWNEFYCKQAQPNLHPESQPKSTSDSDVNTDRKIVENQADNTDLNFSAKLTESYAKKEEDERNEKKDRENFQRNLMIQGSFEHVAMKNRQTYMNMVKIFEQKSVHRRNHVEFIYAALKNMKSFGVNRELEVYKALIDVMPKGKFIPTNMFQQEFMHYPKQQQCIIDLLEQMEENGVIPDYEMEDMLINIFGKRGHPVVRFWRMMYWMPKFKNLSPWLLPNPVPEDVLELALLAVRQMCSVDYQSKVDTWHTKDVESSVDDTWIVSGQSPDQQKLLQSHPKDSSLRVEGPFLIWLRTRSISYFILRGDPVSDELFEDDEDIDDVSDLQLPEMLKTFAPKSKNKKNKIALKRSIHQQDDGTIYAICATGTSTKDSLLSWIRLLEQNGNPNLANTPVLFKFISKIEDQLPAVL